MKTASLAAIASCMASFVFPAFITQGAEPLPKFTFRGVALEGKKLAFAPTGELERSCLIKMEGRVKNPLGKYYMYYSPHKHAGIGLVYSDSIEGPWTEYKGNPVVKDTAIPDIYCPSLLQWQGRNFIVYQDHTGNRGGNVKYMELDSQFNPVGNKTERHVLIDPVPDSPVGNRYRGCEFHREGDTLYMYSGASESPRIIVYATASAAPNGKPPGSETTRKSSKNKSRE